MTVLDKAIQSNIESKNKKRLYHPRVVTVGRVKTEGLAKEVAELSALSPGDVMSTIANLVTVITRHLRDSHSVTLDGLGTVYLTLTSVGKGVEKEEDVSPEQAQLMLRFMPARKRNPNGTTATRAMLTEYTFRRADSLLTEDGKGGIVPDPESPADSGEGGDTDEGV